MEIILPVATVFIFIVLTTASILNKKSVVFYIRYSYGDSSRVTISDAAFYVQGAVFRKQPLSPIAEKL